MEETVRSLLQYKSRVETLKQEKASLSSALETSGAHYQSQLSSLTAENERLRGQLSALSAGLGGDQERRLDDVAQQVVRALLSQKSVREELGCARARVRELEAQNRALSALLVRQLRPIPRPSPATPHTPITPHTPRELQVHLVDVGSCGSLVSFRDSPPPAPPVPQPHPLNQDDKRRHQILSDIWTELKGLEVTPANLARALSAVDPTLWAPPPRPATLSLSMPQPDPIRGISEEKVTEEENGEAGEAGAESPESGAKDEGYSTMSSDVQADASRQSDHAADRALPDLNEASDETDNQTIVSINPRESRRHARLLTSDADYIYFPIGVAFAGVRGSYPPSRPILPFQHVVRSFSDSHLCLKFVAGTTCHSSCLDSPTPSSGVLVLDLNPAPERPLRSRPAIPASTTSSERVSWGSTVDERVAGTQYENDYVQHWLELDDARSALQQRHRDLADLEYDRAELEDWSLSLSCEDLRDRQQSPFAEITTPGQISLSTLPSIREDDALELEEDVGDCLWNDCGFATIEIDECRIGDDHDIVSEKRWDCTGTHSPGGSWSDASDVPDKRSSTALSEDGDCGNVGVDFTRDFYRLVKYESTKSLASNSSRGMPSQDHHLRIHDVQAINSQDREQALQNVLNFIAEQQKYCRDREESDSHSSRPVSEIRELPPPYASADFDDDSVGPRSEISEDRPRPDSFGSFSENDSCEVIPERIRIIYNEAVSEPKSTPRFIEREEPYAESEDFYDEYARNNTENEIDEHHLLKVQRKNEINKSIDMSHLVTDLDDPPLTKEKERPCDIESSRSFEHSSALKENTVNIMLNLQGPITDRVELDNCLTKSSSFPFANGETEMSLVEEVLSACRRSTGALVTVPEEEESSSPETSSPQMTESNTTSTSTAETVIVSNKNDSTPVRREKSRIPMLLGGKRPPSSPNKTRSKIPVVEKNRPNSTQVAPVPETIIVKQEHTLSFHEAATSKDVIEELNRMIRQSEGASAPESKEDRVDRTHSHKDSALWGPSGWVHVEKDIDFSDPKARANLLDVMLASSDSSPSSCGSSPAEPPPPYSRLHRLHRSRRQKTAAALRSRGLAVLRLGRQRRPSILGRDGFFVRYGDCERAAVATFDFLDDLSGGSGSSPEATKDCT
ncbi:hypothetical protein O0L34_g6857 [Tuta absoluta]|nr:hypothetical protein O0L34_g6857 [Tuta absoluta]